MFGTIFSSVWRRKRRLLAACTAVVLGVAFLAATMIFGDTAKAGFSNAFTSANAGTDVVVRSAQRMDTDGERSSGLIDVSTVDVVRAVPGVDEAVPYVEGYAQLVGRDGTVLGGDGPPTLASNWVSDPGLNSFRLAEGRAPGPGPDVEVVIDATSARRGRLRIGDRTTVLTPDRLPVTVVGIATFGDAGSLGPVTYVAFDLATAQRVLTGQTGEISSVLVRADRVTGASDVAERIGTHLPANVEVITGADLTAEQQRNVDTDFLGLFRTLLLAFAGISIVVATFSIHNTFSILVAQRSRESALLRAIGASRRQIVSGVATEAFVVGLVSTAIGFGIGVGLAAALQALMDRSATALPHAHLVIGGSAIVAAAVVGVGTTMLASIGPAIKASRVAPLAALREASIDRSASSTTRAVIGSLVLGGGVATVITATHAADGAVVRAAMGALLTVIGAVVVGPVVARPAAAIIGVAPAALRGIVGRFARRNAMRNPRRTAASASALLVGTAVVALFTTFGASIKASLDDTVERNFSGDLIVVPDGFSGAQLSPDLAPAIETVPGVDTAIGLSFGLLTLGGATVDMAATDPSRLGAVFDVGVTTGSLARFVRGDIALSDKYASEHALHVGSTVPVTFVDGWTEEFTVGATYTDRMTFGDYFIGERDLAPHVAQEAVTVVLIDVDARSDLSATQEAVGEVTSAFGAPAPLDRRGYSDEVGSQVDSMLFVVYALLAVAVLIALLGIGNTLSLSIHDRTRELGVLRAVGQDRSQMRAAVRWESVIIAVFGTIGGIGIGTFLGWGLMRALNVQEGFGVFALPVVPLAVVLGVAAVAGLLAAVRPARRAARTDILAAIASS